MPKYLIVSIFATMLAFAAAAQNEDAPDESLPDDIAAESAETGKAEDATGAAEEEDAADAEEVDDADLDEQTYEEDEDDFIPTEEIPADEPIPFPTNI